MHLAIWIITALLVGLWSLMAWGVAAVVSADPSWVGGLGPLIDRMPYGDVLDLWVPGWQAMLRVTLEVSQSALAWLGTNAHWVVGLVWGAGTLLLVGLAGLLSLVVALLSKPRSPPVPPVGPKAPPSGQH